MQRATRFMQARKYSLVKTLKKGSVLKTTVKNSKKYKYFKARAYVNNASKKRVYGNFCAGVKAKA